MSKFKPGDKVTLIKPIVVIMQKLVWPKFGEVYIVDHTLHNKIALVELIKKADKAELWNNNWFRTANGLDIAKEISRNNT